MSKNEDIADGGAAFPGGITTPSNYHDPCYPTQTGMTLRDWFAGRALAGLLSNSKGNQYQTTHDWAEQAYAQADAMLAERSK